MLNKKETFLKGIENLRATGFAKQLSFISSVKILFFYIYLCTIATPQGIGDKAFFINGLSESKKKDPTEGGFQRLYLRRFSNDYRYLKNSISLVSPLSRRKRLGVILYSIITAPQGGFFRGRWLEFQLLCALFEVCSFEAVCSFGHYDEFTFWLTDLCELNKVKYSMYQHGIVMKSIKIPNKIYCDVAHVYNKYSKNVFEKIIIKNENCVFLIDGFQTNLVFKHISKEKGKKYIGIVDQTFPEWLKDVTHSVSSIDEFVAVVMLHPLTQFNVFDGMNGAIVTREKYDNVDCVISDFSTLVLDYISIGYNEQIICTDKMACEEVFGEYKITYVKKSKLKEMLPILIKNEE